MQFLKVVLFLLLLLANTQFPKELMELYVNKPQDVLRYFQNLKEKVQRKMSLRIYCTDSNNFETKTFKYYNLGSLKAEILKHCGFSSSFHLQIEKTFINDISKQVFTSRSNLNHEEFLNLKDFSRIYVKEDSIDDTIIGIDLGTTFSSVSAYINGKFQVIKVKGKKSIPSKVYFDSYSIYHIGNPLPEFMDRTISLSKKVIGLSKEEYDKKEKISLNNLVEKDGKLMFYVQSNSREYFSPEEISSYILKFLKEAAEKISIKGTITEAVITVPADFNRNQLSATQKAAQMAGFQKIHFLKEPIAAAFADYEDQDKSKPLKIFIVDFGGGTLDLSHLIIENEKYTVNQTGGISIGGQDFTDSIFNYAKSQIWGHNDKKSMYQLMSSCEKAKYELTHSLNSQVILPTGKSLDITREKFNELTKDKLNAVVKVIEDFSKEKEFDLVSLVGGASLMIKFQEIMKKIFGKKLKYHHDSKIAITRGATIYGNLLKNQKKKFQFLDILPNSIGGFFQNATTEKWYGTLIRKGCILNKDCYSKQSLSFAKEHILEKKLTWRIFEGEDPKLTLIGDLDFPIETKEFMKHGGKGDFELEMNVDSNGILTLTTTEYINGKKNTKNYETRTSHSFSNSDTELLNEINELDLLVDPMIYKIENFLERIDSNVKKSIEIYNKWRNDRNIDPLIGNYVEIINNYYISHLDILNENEENKKRMEQEKIKQIKEEKIKKIEEEKMKKIEQERLKKINKEKKKKDEEEKMKMIEEKMKKMVEELEQEKMRKIQERTIEEEKMKRMVEELEQEKMRKIQERTIEEEKIKRMEEEMKKMKEKQEKENQFSLMFLLPYILLIGTTCGSLIFGYLYFDRTRNDPIANDYINRMNPNR